MAREIEPKLRYSKQDDDELKRIWQRAGVPLECTVPAEEHKGEIHFTLGRPRCELHYPMFEWTGEVTVGNRNDPATRDNC